MSNGDGPNPTNTPSAEALERFSAYIELQKEQLELRREEAKIVNDQIAELKIQAELDQANLAKKAQALDAELSKINERLASTEQLSASERRRLEDRKTLLSIDISMNARERAKNKEQLKTQRELDNFASGIAGKLGMQAKFADTKLGKFKLLVESTKNMSDGQEYINTLMANFLDTSNLVVSALSFMYESVMLVALGLETANAELRRSTGFSQDFRDTMFGITAAGVASGVTMADAGKAMGSLASSFSAFNPNAEATNEALGTSIALLGKTGVSGEQAAKTMDFFNRTLGVTPVAAARMTEQLALSGTKIGISTSKMLSDFESVNGYLIGFGERMDDVFLGLQAQAKATGIAIGSLVGIAKKFDSFDEAAKTVGSLNAALGTNLSTVDMINMSAEQRIAMLAQEIDFASGGFDNLDRYTQMYVAQAIGAKDAAEAQRLINLQRNPAELAKYNSEMQAQQARQEDLNKLTQQFVPIMEQLKIAVLALGVALGPLVYVAGFVIDVFSQIIQNLVLAITYSDFTRGAFTLLGLGLAAFAAYTFVPMLFSAMAAGIKAIGLASRYATVGGVLGLLLLFGSMAQVLATRINPVFVAAFHFMAVGIRTMAMAMNAAQPQALIFAIAFALIAGSVALVVYAMSDLLVAMTGLFGLFIENVATLPQLAQGLYLVGGAFIVFGAGLLIGAYALGTAVPLLLMTAVMLPFITEKVAALGHAFGLVGAGVEQMVQGLEAIKNFKDGDEFFAITTDGGKTSMVSAKGGVLKSFSAEAITVEVKIPEIQMPEINVYVKIGDTELRDMIITEVEKRT